MSLPPKTDADHVKHARPDHDVLDVIRHRWSPRAFADRPVEPGKLRRVLEAARWAPSSYNEQPWRFLVATKDDPAAYDKLLGGLNEYNRSWAKTAPVLMVSVAKTHFSESGKENRHAWHDVGLAAAHLVLQAADLGLYAHQMAGILPEEIRAAYGIPDAFEPVAGFALGYRGDPAQLSEKMKKSETAPRQRRPLAETVFGTAWNETASIVREN